MNYAYDANGRQTSAAYGSFTETQTHDSAGQRVQTSVTFVGTSTRTMVYDIFGQLVADYNGSSGSYLESENIYRGGQLLARYDAGLSSWKYLLTDAQGSARAVMNNNGSSSSVIARHDYLPFGEEIASSLRPSGQGYGATDYNRQKYAMTERDDVTGLDHTWFRKYEGFGGRWTSPDPLHGSLGDPQSFNGYSYTGNDPVNSVDPSGLTYEVCGAEFGGAACMGEGFWGGGFNMSSHTSFLGNSGQQTVTPNFLSDVRSVTYKWSWYDEENSVIYSYTLAPFLRTSLESTPFTQIRDLAVRGAKTIVHNELKFIRCFENNRFSADISNLTQGTRVHGAATFLAQAAEILPAFSVAGDAAAMSAKAARPGLLGTTKIEASGINWVLRRMFSGALKGTLQQVGGKVITPVMAGVFAFTTGYNVAKAAGCRMDNPAP